MTRVCGRQTNAGSDLVALPNKPLFLGKWLAVLCVAVCLLAACSVSFFAPYDPVTDAAKRRKMEKTARVPAELAMENIQLAAETAIHVAVANAKLAAQDTINQSAGLALL